jgi:pyruvate/2-oxoglutarate/acetoin dehydrogenase E1 component
MPDHPIKTYRAAVIEALAAEMRSDPRVLIIGEDVGAAGGVFLQTEGLFKEFGAGRVIDTPISEPGAFGMAVGAAMVGLRPVFEVMFGDFITLVMDQLVNQAAKMHYMSNGRFRVPLVLRTTMGTGSNLGPQHSQSLYAWAAHVPGLKIAIPATPADAKGLFTAAMRDDNPVLVFEDRLLYGVKGPVPIGDYIVPLGLADVARVGDDLTIVTIGRMRTHALQAAERLQQQGVSVEVIDIRTLVPLDRDTLLTSLRKTNRVMVVDGAPRSWGASAEIAAMLSDQGFDWLDAPVTRLAGEDIPVPMSRSLEPLVQPNAQRIEAAALALVRS